MDEQREWAYRQIILSEIEYRENLCGKKRFKDMEYYEGKFVRTLPEFYIGMIAVRLDGKNVSKRTLQRYLYNEKTVGKKFDSFVKASLKVLNIKQDIMEKMVDKCLECKSKNLIICKEVYEKKIRTILVEYQRHLVDYVNSDAFQDFRKECDKALALLENQNKMQFNDITQLIKECNFNSAEMINLYNHYSRLSARIQDLWTSILLGDNKKIIKEKISGKRIYLRNVKCCEDLRTLLDIAYMYDYKKKGQEEIMNLSMLYSSYSPTINTSWLYNIIMFMSYHEYQKRALIDLSIQYLYLKN
ncbi:hypothetical protein [Hungatella sp.]|uniref:hypothetical protein n=1 Tax=Hungatella sp. TaxID=2613924 RepID=UPI002A826A55|nr:hypothetical protein [Hungatella sp.]